MKVIRIRQQLLARIRLAAKQTNLEKLIGRVAEVEVDASRWSLVE